MSLIDRIYLKCQTIVNTELRGNVDPGDFNNILHQCIQERFEELLKDINRELNRQSRGLASNNLENLPKILREKVMHYHTTTTLALDTASTRLVPSDLRYLDTIELSDGTFLEECANRKEFNILKGTAKADYPIFLKSGDTYWIAPDDSGLMSISYLKEPEIPKWTYIDDDGNPLFNPSNADYKDADIHPSEEDTMVVRVCKYFGVNLKEEDVAQFAMSESEVEFRNKNTD